MPELTSLNPLSSVGIGTVGMVLLIFFLAILVVMLIGVGVFVYVQRKQLKYSIPLQKKIGNTVLKVATYKAKNFAIGRAGDKLWYVPKAKKYISPATIQTAPNEYTHFEREDGEWINVGYPDVDQEMKTLGVKFVHQDMRAQRIAIGDILENRFADKKGFWEKYGHLIMHVIFYMVVMIGMVVIFYQWGDIIERTSALLDKIIAYEKSQKETTGVVPALIPLLLWRFKKK